MERERGQIWRLKQGYCRELSEIFMYLCYRGGEGGAIGLLLMGDSRARLIGNGVLPRLNGFPLMLRSRGVTKRLVSIVEFSKLKIL